MSKTAQPFGDATAPMLADELSTLSWVHDELRRSLEAANKALRRYVREAQAAGVSDVDAVDPAVLRGARAQLHQGVGALELVGQTLAARALRAAEMAVQRLAAKPALATGAAVETIERLSFAVLDLLGRLLAGKPVRPLALFPQYAAAQALAGAERAHPADLWGADWQWRAMPAAADEGAGRAADAAALADMEGLALVLMRQDEPEAQREMVELCDGLAAGSDRAAAATLWRLAAAFYEGQRLGLIDTDLHTKRIASRLLAVLRSTHRGTPEAPERLAQDLVFFGVRAELPAEAAHVAPRLATLQSVWPADPTLRLDYAQPHLGLVDPALVQQARRRVGSAKEAWTAVAGGDLARMSALAESMALLSDSVQRLLPGGAALAEALQTTTSEVVHAAVVPSAPLAMEVATGVLYLDAVFDDGELDSPDLAPRLACLAERVRDVAGGAAPRALEGWMEELYRRMSDRQTLGNVVHELRGSLADVEKRIDQFFRDPSQVDGLREVPAELVSMRGVLSVLGLDQASLAIQRMRVEVETLIADGPTQGLQAPAVQSAFDRLADNLGSLGFLLDMLGVQPQAAKSLFRFDAERGVLQAVMGQGERTSAWGGFAHTQAVADTRDAGPTTRPAASLAPEMRLDLRGDAPATGTAAAHVAAAAAAPAAPAAPAPAGDLDDDAEMREVFLEEAREVIAEARASIGRLGEVGQDVAEITAVRRAFHTLKGSSRMVGLNAFGEAAWSCEQLYNARLAQQKGMDPDLHGLTAEVLDHLQQWVDAIAAGDTAGFGPAPVVEAADALRTEGRRLPIVAQPVAAVVETPEIPEMPATAETAETAETAAAPADPLPEAEAFELALPPLDAVVPDLPSESDLDLPALAPLAGPADGPVETVVAEALPPVPEADDAGFELDLGEPDEGPAPLQVADVAEPLTPGEITQPLAAFEPPAAEPADEPVAELAHEPPPAVEDEQFKLVGPLRIAIPLFNIFLNESDEQSRRLATELAEWSLEPHRPVGETAIALAHSLAGNSAAVGHEELSDLARALEHALLRSNAVGFGDAAETALFSEVAEEIRRLLHQFAAGFLKPVREGLMERLAEHEHHASVPERDTVAPAIDDDDGAAQDVQAPGPVLTMSGDGPLPIDGDEAIDATDEIDPELFPIFEEEAEELLPQLHARLADWVRHPHGDGAAACLRTLHTFKGGARLAGAMRLGEWAHRLESDIEHLAAQPGGATAEPIERLLARADGMAAAFERLRRGPVAAPVAESAPPAAAVPAMPATPAPVAPAAPVVAAMPDLSDVPQDEPAPMPVHGAAIDWSRFTGTPQPEDVVVEPAELAGTGTQAASVRVRAQLLDRLVNQAGEVSITRARLEGGLRALQGSLGDLTDNLERLRRQLRDIELQAESQISSRMEAAKAASQSFDPLELDRFTRFQELTRMMAESVNDVATVQRNLQRNLQSSEDELAAQARLTRELQDDLLRTRMSEFESLADRLYRVVRQASRETDKPVRLDIVGGTIEVDRGVLERMVGPFEHLLRNAVAHGIEPAAERRSAGKDASGVITITVRQEGNEVAVEIADDGAGLRLDRIRARAVERGLIAADASISDAELGQMIFVPGFSTAESVTGLAGRGVGMDVVRAEVNAMGGRIEVDSRPGKGTRFTLLLPLTTAVTQVVMLGYGGRRVAVPATLVEVVRRVPSPAVAQAYVYGQLEHEGQAVPFFWLGALLQAEGRGAGESRSHLVVMLRSAAQRVAVHVDEVLGNQEVVVKAVGPQLARLPGLAGVTLLPSGAVALIYNPVALASVYGDDARQRALGAATGAGGADGAGAAAEDAAPVALAPLVLVVDDSLTVRRVTQRLLAREGYRVAVAKDGLEALEQLAVERPSVLLSDIEMPRMDGFDLVRNVRSDSRWQGLPVIMITSRIAAKHREVAEELGVDHYLGKPYNEEELLALVARHTAPADAG